MKLICNIFLMLYLVCKPVLPLMEYVANYDYISGTLCVNQKKPELHCNGKCYLAKQLAKSTQEDTSKTKNQFQKIVDFYIPVAISNIQPLNHKISINLPFTTSTDYSYLYLKHVFRPPIV